MKTKQSTIIVSRGKLYIPDTCSVQAATDLVRRYNTYDVEIVKINESAREIKNEV